MTTLCWQLFPQKREEIQLCKVEKILKGRLDWIPSPSPSVKIQIMGRKVFLRCKSDHFWALSTNFLFSKVLLITPGNVLPLHLKQTFPPIIWNFTEGEGGGMESRLSFEIFFTLLGTNLWLRQSPTTAYFDLTTFSQEVSSSNHVKKSSLDLEHKLLRYSKINFRTRVKN